MTASRGSSWWTAGWTGRTPAGRRRKSSGSSLKTGDFTEEDLESARRSACQAFGSVGDSQGAQASWYLGQCLLPGVSTPEEASKALAAVTRERVVAAAERVTLESVYLLTQEPEGEGSDNA